MTVSKATSIETSTARVSQSRTRSLSEAQFAYLFLLPLVLFLFLAAVFPLAYSFWISLNEVTFSLTDWRFVGLTQFTRALSDPMTGQAISLSLIYAATVTVLCLVISMAGALLLNEAFRGQRLLLLLSILPMALSTYATAILWRYIFAQNIGFLNAILKYLGLVDTGVTFVTSSSAIYMVAIAHSWQMAPFGMSFFLAALQVIPPDMYRVARIDRLGVLGRFRHVTLPYLRGTILATSILFAIAAFKVFDIIYFLTTGGPGGASTTMTYHVYLQTFRAYNYGYGAALAYLLMGMLLVLLVFYFIAYRRQRRDMGA